MSNSPKKVRVSCETYCAHEDMFDSMSGEYCTYEPRNLHGGVVPMGITAADKNRNLRSVVDDMADRLGVR